jgi:hypothetical protein
MKRILGFFLVLMSILFVSCEQANRADLVSILSSSALPYLKESRLIQVSSFDTTGGNSDMITIPAGKRATILNVTGPGVISRFWCTVDSRDPYFLRRILIRMYWDEETSPSVEVPLGDFFGCGFEYKQYTTPYLSMSSGGYTCFFPMPFEGNARIEIVNETGREINAFYFQIDYHKLDKPLRNDVGYFHAWWNRNVRTSRDSAYTVLRASGNGHIVGVNLNMQSYDGSLSFLEGDEMIYVDNEKKPSIHGTGTEDYFSSGWYFNKGEYAGPYNGLIYKNDSLGRIAAYRFHIQDAIPFRKNIRFVIEHGHADQEVADYSSTIYWYQIEPHRPFPPIAKPGLRLPLRAAVPNHLMEAEKLNFVLGTMATQVQDMTDFGPEWSGGRQFVIHAGERSEFPLVLTGLEENSYSLDLYYTKGPDYGNVRIFNGEKLVGEIRGFSPMIVPGGKITIGDLENRGGIALRFEMTGKDPSSSGYTIGLDGITLTPKRSFISDWYVAGPFPNPETKLGVRSGLDSVNFPDEEIDLKAVRLVSGKQIRWQYVQTPENGYIDLASLIRPSEKVVSYAVTYIFAPWETKATLMIGSDDGAKVYFNNREVYRFYGIRVAEPDQASIPVTVKKGWNKLLLKLENNIGGFGFYARIPDRDGILWYSASQVNPAKGTSTMVKK